MALRSPAWLVTALRGGMHCGVLLANPAVSVRHGGGVMRVELLYVPPLYRRRGVGHGLVEFVCAHAGPAASRPSRRCSTRPMSPRRRGCAASVFTVSGRALFVRGEE